MKRARRGPDGASFLISSKLTLDSGYIQEVKVWRTPRSEMYPNGVRYRLALADTKTGECVLLYDNHWPKGHHVHVGKRESSYRFKSIEQLMKDFLDGVEKIERDEA